MWDWGVQRHFCQLETRLHHAHERRRRRQPPCSVQAATRSSGVWAGLTNVTRGIQRYFRQLERVFATSMGVGAAAASPPAALSLQL